MAITTIHLLRVPFSNDYKHTLYFADRAAQTAHFANKAQRKTYNDVTYQRKDEKIRFNAQYDEVATYNYCMYQNPAYNNMWFYAFITDVKYISDGVTEIYIETDVMQTYIDKYTIKQCFIDREHTKDDTIGANTVPEGLETGEYMVAGQTSYNGGFDNYKYVVASTKTPQVIDPDAEGNAKYLTAGNVEYNGIYSSVGYFRFDTGEKMSNFITLLNKAGMLDAIHCVFVAPEQLVPLQSTGADIHNYGQVDPSTLPYKQNFRVAKEYLDSTITGIRNNKLKTFPYCYLIASNLQGSEAIYRYEDFANEWCNFNMFGALTPGCSVRLVPTYYKGSDSEEVDIEGLTLAKFPICNYQGDVYTNWLVQNSANIAAAETAGGLAVAGGLLTTALGVVACATGVGAVAGASMIGGGIMSTLSGVNQIQSNLASIEQQSFTPPQARGNLNSGDAMAANKKIEFRFYAMSIKPEYAKIIDDYFTMYGYKTNRVKHPNTNHRERFWFTKTIGCSVDGSMSQKDIQKINSIYDNGITFWKNEDEIGDYSQPNGTV